MSVIYGIDLGTTFTSAAYCTPDGHVNVCEFDAGRGDGTTVNVLPSIVLLDRLDGKRYAYVGQRAKTEFTDPDNQRYFEMVKRKVGTIEADTKRPWAWKFDGDEFRPQEIQALMLRGLKRLIRAKNYPPLERAVISHPQGFSDPQKKATAESARLAGIEVVDTITEPAAAALAYGIDERIASGEKPRTVFVFDLGGGTFDIVIQEIKRPPLQITGLTCEGSAVLGGRDWDDLIYDRFKTALEQGSGLKFSEAATDLDVRRLQDLANLTKEALSAETVTSVPIKFAGLRKLMTISQDDFHAWSINLLEKVRSYCQRALERVGKRAADIDDVLLVGGSVMMPMIRELVQQLFGREARFDARNVRTLVAQGAALWAYRCELNDPDHPGAGALSGEPQETALAVSTPGVVKQALPRGFGVLVVDRLGEERIETLLAKDTTCPTSITKTFPVVDPRARRVRIGFYEGESDCRIDCVHVGDVVLEVPPQTGAREIKLSLSVDESTRLRIDAIDLQSGVGRELLIENHAQISVDQFEDRRRLLKEFEIVV